MEEQMESDARAIGPRLLDGLPVFKKQMGDYLWCRYGIGGISASKSYHDIWEQALLPKYGLEILTHVCLAEMRKRLSSEDFAKLKEAWQSGRSIPAEEWEAFPWEWKYALLQQDRTSGRISWTDFANFFFKYEKFGTAPSKEDVLAAAESIKVDRVSTQEKTEGAEQVGPASIRKAVDRRDDLALLGLSTKDRTKLESMGIISSEQIALHDINSLGMGKTKGHSLIQRAWNILANWHIQDIEIEPDQITVLADEISEAIMLAVKGILHAYDSPELGNCMIQSVGNRILLRPRAGRDFSHVIEEAKRRQQILEARERQFLERLGVTIGEETIVDFARQRGFDGFWQEVFSPISGNEIMKKALAVSMFSTSSEPVHVLVVGEPAGGKTLSRDIIADNFKDLTKVGAIATRAGLVCNLASGQLGALAFSDQKLVLVDEFDKIPEGDMEYCYELLSNGRCQVDSARIHDTIESHFIMIAFANPMHGVFRGSPLDEIGLPATLMSRFAFVVKTEPLDRAAMQELFLSKYYRKSELQSLPDYYDQWVKLARLYVPKIETSPDKVKAYVNEVVDLVEEYRGTPLRRDERMGDYIARVPVSIARAEFRNLTDSDLTSALELFMQSIQEWRR